VRWFRLKIFFGSTKRFPLTFSTFRAKAKMSGAPCIAPVLLEILFRFQAKWLSLIFSLFRTKTKMSATPERLEGTGQQGARKVHTGEARKKLVMLNNKPKYGKTTILSYVDI
jgi:hypothetical protein